MNVHLQQFICLAGLMGMCLQLSFAQVENQDSIPSRPTVRPMPRPGVDTNILDQIDLITLARAEMRSLENELERGPNILSQEQLDAVQRDLDAAVKILEAEGVKLSWTTLNTLELVLTQIDRELTESGEEVRSYNNGIKRSMRQLNQLINDSLRVDALPRKPELQAMFEQEYNKLKNDWQGLGNKAYQELLGLTLVSTNIEAQTLRCERGLESLNEAKDAFPKQIIGREYQPLLATQVGAYDLPGMEPVIPASLHGISQVLQYFLSTDGTIRFFNILIILGFFFWTRRSLRKIRKRKPEEVERILNPIKYVPGHTFLSALLVGGTIAPFLYRSMPVVYTELLWLILFVALFFIIRRHWPAPSKRYFLLLFGLILAQTLSNLLFYPTFTERWLALGLEVGGMLTAWRLRNYVQSLPFQSKKWVKTVFTIALVLCGLALIFNLTGRFSLAKIFNTTGLYGMVFAVSIATFIDIILEAFYLQREASSKETSFGSWLKYYNIDKRLRGGLQIIGMAIWLMILLKNLILYDIVYNDLSQFFTKQRNLGEIEFNYLSILIFILVLWFTSIITQLVTFLFGSHSGPKKQSRWSNYLLLIRIGIFSIGFLVAVSAAGIPLDQLAIVLGALSVGIGFGLQTIVNNLVSGIILAFEQPLKVGDIIEVGTRTGTVKEIGIRASRITTFEGAEVIVPNGDLLAQHLINWTLSDSKRRIELLIGVAYGTPTQAVKDIIKKALSEHQEILPDPEPMILVSKLADSSVVFRVLFWSKNEGWLGLQSEVLNNIYEQLQQEGIEIPLPKRDITIRMKDGDSRILAAETREETGQLKEPPHMPGE